jgi:hypothetical protein
LRAIRHFQARLGSEAIRIGQARGYKLEEIDHLPPETIARAGEGDLAALKTYDERRLSRVGRGSPDQRPSMGQDMAKCRRTKIEFLNGLSCGKANRSAFKRAPTSGLWTSSRKSSARRRYSAQAAAERSKARASSRPTVPRRLGAETAALAADHDFISHRIPAV